MIALSLEKETHLWISIQIFTLKCYEANFLGGGGDYDHFAQIKITVCW